jgi:hypothetical protein
MMEVHVFHILSQLICAVSPRSMRRQGIPKQNKKKIEIKINFWDLCSAYPAFPGGSRR